MTFPPRRSHTTESTNPRKARARRTVASLGALVLVGTLFTWLAPPAQALDFSKCTKSLIIGQSREGRPIRACERGDLSQPSLLVLGQLHGDERAGYWTASRLLTATLPAKVHLWIIPTANPDGFAHRKRQNARGVDLNRNFPTAWAKKPSPYYSGPSPASEPETKALMAFVKKYQPHTTTSIHQPLYLVDYGVGGDPSVTRYVAKGMGFPIRSLTGPAYTGTFTRWSNSAVSFSTAHTFEYGRSVSSAQHARMVTTMINLAKWRAGHLYPTRIVATNKVTNTATGPTVTMTGQMQWLNYQNVWTPLKNRTLVIQSHPISSGPFVTIGSVISSTKDGRFSKTVKPSASSCVRTNFLARPFLAADPGPITCVTVPT